MRWFARVVASRETYFQPQLFHLQQRLRVSARIVDRIVRMLRFTEMFEIHEGVLLHPFVERSEICRAEAEWIFTDEVMKVPVDKLPIESVVVRDKHRTTLTVGSQPFAKLFHHLLRIIECKTLFTCESTDGKSVWNKLLGYRLEPSVKRAVQFGLDNDRAETNH